MEVKEYFYGDGYFPKLYLEGTTIVDVRCRCKWGQVHANAWRTGEGICKHLQSAIREYSLEMKNKKKPKSQMIGYVTCPNWLKDAYRKAVLFVCEDCRKNEDECGKLEPHRLLQGYKGGTYCPRNVKMLCKKDHLKYAEEW